jgi:hypothetical protein
MFQLGMLVAGDCSTMPSYEASAWYGRRRAQVCKLNKEIHAALARAVMKVRLAGWEGQCCPLPPLDYGQLQHQSAVRSILLAAKFRNALFREPGRCCAASSFPAACLKGVIRYRSIWMAMSGSASSGLRRNCGMDAMGHKRHPAVQKGSREVAAQRDATGSHAPRPR